MSNESTKLIQLQNVVLLQKSLESRHPGSVNTAALTKTFQPKSTSLDESVKVKLVIAAVFLEEIIKPDLGLSNGNQRT